MAPNPNPYLTSRQVLATFPSRLCGRAARGIPQGLCEPQSLVPVPSTVKPPWTCVHLASLRFCLDTGGQADSTAPPPSLCWKGLGFRHFESETVITGGGREHACVGKSRGAWSPHCAPGVTHLQSRQQPCQVAHPYCPCFPSPGWRQGAEWPGQGPVWGRDRASEQLS